MSDEDKIRLQVYSDVLAYGDELLSVQINPQSDTAYQALLTLVQEYKLLHSDVTLDN